MTHDSVRGPYQIRTRARTTELATFACDASNSFDGLPSQSKEGKARP